MNSTLKKQIVLAAAALTLCHCAPFAGAAADDKSADIFPDPVVASGKGFEIKRSQLEDGFLSYNSSVAASGGTIREEERAIVRSNLLQHMIINKILVQRATDEDKTLTRKLVDDEIEEARKSAPSPEAFNAGIKASGMTLDQVRSRAFEEQLCHRVLQHEITNGITVPDAEVKKFYDDHPDKFERPEEVRAAHVLISTMDPATQQPLPPDQIKAKEKLARDIRARAEKGEDFGKLVQEYSDDPGSKKKNGEYTFPKGQMVPQFEAAAFSLKTNQISDLVETKYGYHIIKLLEKIPAKKESFDEIKDKIKLYLVDEQFKKQLPGYLDKLKSDYKVTLAKADDAK